MSPKEFYALTKCYQEQEERMDRRFATMQAFYVNCNSDKKLTADDFMGTTKRKVTPPVNEHFLETQLTALFGVGPGKVETNV
jgi:hypothetical protein